MHNATPCSLDWIVAARRPRDPSSSARELRVVDLFSGCGGMTLGVVEGARLNTVKAKVVLAVDLNAQALEVFSTNFKVKSPIVRNKKVEDVFNGRDNRKCTLEELALKDDIGSVDIVVAGPPCQGHSSLNNSTRRDDPRNELYLTLVRAAKVLEPKVMIIENVPDVVNCHSQVVQRCERSLRKLGYKTSMGKISLTELGLPQCRNRHLLIAARMQKVEFSYVSSSYATEVSAIGEYIGDIMDECRQKQGLFYEASTASKENKKRIRYLFRKRLYDLPNSQRPPCHRDKKHTYKSMYGRLKWDEPAQTITSGFGCMGQGRYVHTYRERTLTPHEAARIQGLPDFFDFGTVKTLTALRKIIANAVPPRLTAVFVDYLLRQGIL